MILRLSFYLLITHVPILLRPPEKKKLKKTCKQPPTFSEIASFLTPPYPGISVALRVGAGGEEIFWNYTLPEKDEIYCFINLFCNLIYLFSQFVFL